MNILKILLLVFTTSILSAQSASSIYLHKCAGCHGHDAEKTVMGKSKIIKNMKVADIEEAIYNYAAGTCKIEIKVCEKKITMIQYGKKALIQGYTKEQIHGLAVYITGL